MNRRQMLMVLLSVAIGAGLTVSAVSEVSAKQKQKLSYKASAADTKYTQQHTIDVGDAPGHQIRIFTIHRVFPTNPPMFDGVAVAEHWSHGASDYIDNTGTAKTYGYYIMSGGDKIFTRNELVSQSVVNSDGSRKSTATAVGLITGGTGKFRGIQGRTNSVSNFDQKAGFNETQVEIEYWIEK